MAALVLVLVVCVVNMLMCVLFASVIVRMLVLIVCVTTHLGPPPLFL